jgi:hypothetical protein
VDVDERHRAGERGDLVRDPVLLGFGPRGEDPVSRALRKLDARDRSQLVMLAYETGLVVPQASASRQATPALVAA